ncbi:unnamed protein product [Pieris macdunnoughi]|uniref:Regulatory protein zeste n=1 Tax=Pieris macdunnoughi TaxID=345717 RepID=A0A821WM16_9NEOP|nr:unnamed protein product [Pieris macdunnoughi]
MNRDRAINFNSCEIHILVDLVSKDRYIIENKRNDVATNKEKEATWNKLSINFNAVSGFTPRTAKTLKLKYESLKKAIRRKISRHIELGNSGEPNLSDIEKTILNIYSNGVESRNDTENVIEFRVKSENSDEDLNERSLLKTPEDVDYVIPDVMDDTTVIENKRKSISKGQSQKTVRKKVDGISNIYSSNVASAKLELIELQKNIASREHDFVHEEHKLKMQHLLNEEKRKQEIHDFLLRKQT